MNFPSSAAASPKRQRENKSKQWHDRSDVGIHPLIGCSGVLLTCERGREMKCQREGMEILRHYLERSYLSREQPSRTKVEAQERNTPEAEIQTGMGTQIESGCVSGNAASSQCFTDSLESELRTLRQQHQQTRGNQRPPRSGGEGLSVCETGCRGTVLVLLSTQSKGGRASPVGKMSATTDPPMDASTFLDTDIVRANKRVTEGMAVVLDASETVQACITHGIDTGGDSESVAIKKQPSKVTSCKRRKTSPSSIEGLTTHPNKGSPLQIAKDGNADDSFWMAEEWDPVVTVEAILREASPGSIKSPSTGSSLPPSSRFVTRIIPLQATCFASLTEIQATTQAVLRRFLQRDSAASAVTAPPSEIDEGEYLTTTATPQLPATRTTTFGIFVKRRNCSHLSSQKIIDALASDVIPPLVPSTWKVHLKDPDVKIWVEICRTTVGVSVFRVSSSTILRTCGSNFNLAEVRASSKV